MTSLTTIAWESMPTLFGHRYRAQISQPSWVALLGQPETPVWAFSAKQSEDIFVGSGIHRQFLPSDAYLTASAEPLFLHMDYESASGPVAILSKHLVHISPTGVTFDLYSESPMPEAACTTHYQALFCNVVEPHISLLDRRDSPTLAEWQIAVAEAQTAISSGELTKVVLSRKSTFRQNQDSESEGLYTGFGKRLEDPNSYHYFYKDSQSTIMGHSPEALFRAKGDDVSVDVVAGTRASESDESLLDAMKDLAEHDIVLDYVRDILSVYGSVKKTVRTELSLGALTHLHQCVTASIDRSHWGTIINALHPTPAICGAPKMKAAHLISRLERNPRGWYGGVFGMSTENTLDLAVAIRGVHLTDTTCITQVGAGIVAASDPLQEWEELNRKLDSVIGVLGGVVGTAP